MTIVTSSNASTVRYRVTGMDCPSCATKIEAAARKVPGITEIKVSIASQEMNLRVQDAAGMLPEVERTVEGLGYQLARLDTSNGDEDKNPDLTHVTTAYKRAVDRCNSECGLRRS